MRKQTIPGVETGRDPSAAGSWLDLEHLAAAELSSEDPLHPFEQALHLDMAEGWRAATPGPQSIRLRFDAPQSIRRIRVEFREERFSRSQEFALFATSATSPRKELVRQQWEFSPAGSATEVEDYTFHLDGITVLELEIDPGRHDKQVFASIQSLQVG